MTVVMCETYRRHLLAKLGEVIPLDRHLSGLTVEELEFILNSATESSFLSACPGSGKTEVMGLKAAYEICRWDKTTTGIAVLSFTRNSAKEIRDRVAKYSGQVKYPHFVGTIDSWLHGYILQPFAHSVVGYCGDHGDKSIRIVESDPNVPYFNKYNVLPNKPTGGKYVPIKITDYSLNWDLDIRPCRERLQPFDAKTRQDLRQMKETFAEDGFATYEDAEFWVCRTLLRKPEVCAIVAKRFPAALIDECQDLSPVQVKTIDLLHHAGMSIHFAGDMHQSIYSFRGVDPKIVVKFAKDHGLKSMELTSNFRSRQQIVDLCSRLVGESGICGREDSAAESRCLLWQYERSCLDQLVERFEAFLSTKKVAHEDGVVLARSHEIISELLSSASGPSGGGLAAIMATGIAAWDDSNRRTCGIDEATRNCGRFLSSLAHERPGPSNEYFCPPTLSPAAWRRLVREFYRKCLPRIGLQRGGASMTWSSWAKELRACLSDFWTEIPGSTADLERALERVRAPSGMKDKHVVDALHKVGGHRSEIRVTTFHDVKGEGMQVVLVVSAADERSRGGHFRQWLSDRESEYARFAYVACSRPREWLIVATPRLSERDLAQLTAIGLVDVGSELL
jgi:DNA helicase-2/ATP-dependent DNA helicase PcrA